jgi:tRNA nucleotidyltransferase (CCA-adding enzyme)
VHVVRHHLIPYEDDWSDAAVRRWVRRVDPARVHDVLEVARGDAMGKGFDPQPQLDVLERLRSRVVALEAAGMALSTRDLAVNGRDIMSTLGLKPGPWVGKVLAHLVELVVDDPSVNEAEALLEHARRFVEASSAELSD